MEKLLFDLLNMDTRNPPGNERIAAAFIRDYLSDAPCDARLQGENALRCNVVARVRGQAPGGALLLNGHLDTVPSGEGWHSDPVKAIQRDGRIYARGASDMKSGLAAMLYAFRRLALSGRVPAHDVIFAGTYDEESFGDGAHTLSKSGELDGVTSVVIGEPTGNGLGLASKGCIWLRACVSGRTSHGAYPERGVNAVEAALQWAGLVKDAVGAGEHPLLGAPSATITRISGGVKANMVPDRAEITMDIRTLPGTRNAALTETARAGARSLMRAQPGLLIEPFVDNDRPPVETDENAPVAALLSECFCSELGRAPARTGSAFFSDASVFLQYGAFDTVLFGPGESALAHTPDESVSLDAYRDCVRVYEALLKRA